MDEALDKQLGEGDNKLKDERESTSRTSTPTSTIPFPSSTSRSRLSKVSTDTDGVELGAVATPTRHSFAVLDDGTSPTEGVGSLIAEETQKGLSLDPAMFGAMSREELEKMLSEADRIIREKEEGEFDLLSSASTTSLGADADRGIVCYRAVGLHFGWRRYLLPLLATSPSSSLTCSSFRRPTPRVPQSEEPT